MAAIRTAVSLEELLALNDEMRALARAGIPLESGLQAVGEDLPGKLGRLATEISKRLERGEGLATVLQDPSLALPPVYSAVVAAGVRTGRLSAALESLTKSVQRSADLRRTLIVALIYPFIVLLIATALFAFTWSALFPVMRQILPGILEREMPAWFQWLTWTVDHGGLGLLMVWILLAVIPIIWFVRSRQAMYFASGGTWWPSIRSVSSAGRVATFAETLALLVEHQVTLVEALILAGAASGDRRVRAAADQMAEQIRSGQRGGNVPSGLPPLLGWLILTNAPSTQLVKTLRQTAQGLRDRALRASMMLCIYLPILLSASVGGILGIYYAILVMTPFYFLLLQLAQP